MSAPEGVDPETGEITGPVHYPDRIRLNNEPMDEVEAKRITRRIKTYGVRMCQEIVRAYDGSAHLALGCKTWEDYCGKHLGISRQRAHQVIDAARKTSNLALMVEVSPDLLVMPERWLRDLTPEEAAELASTAVDAVNPDASEDERAAAVVDAAEDLHRTKVTHRRSESTTTEISSGQVPAPGADDSGGEAQLPAATSPGAPTAQRDEGSGDSATEQETDAAAPVSGLAVDAAPDAAPGEQDASGENAENPSGTCGEDLGQEAGGASDEATPASRDGATASATGGPASDPSPASSGVGPDAAPEPAASGPADQIAEWRALATGPFTSDLTVALRQALCAACDLIDVLNNKPPRAASAGAGNEPTASAQQEQP